MPLVTRAAQHNQVLGLLAPETGVRAVMDLETVCRGAEAAGSSRPFKGDRTDPLPVRRAQVIAIGQAAKRGDRQLHLLVRLPQLQAGDRRDAA